MWCQDAAYFVRAAQSPRQPGRVLRFQPWDVDRGLAVVYRSTTRGREASISTPRCGEGAITFTSREPRGVIQLSGILGVRRTEPPPQ